MARKAKPFCTWLGSDAARSFRASLRWILADPDLYQALAYAWEMGYQAAQAAPRDPAEIRQILTEDAIHNWDAAYVQQRWRHLPEAVKAAAHAAMVRHHQQGTSAREEARALNERFGLTA